MLVFKVFVPLFKIILNKHFWKLQIFQVFLITILIGVLQPKRRHTLI